MFEDISDAFLLFRGRLVARLRLFRLCCFDTTVLDAVAQLVDGQAGARLSGSDGVEIGTVCVLVRKNGPAGLYQTPRLFSPPRPTGTSAMLTSRRSASWWRGSYAFT